MKRLGLLVLAALCVIPMLNAVRVTAQTPAAAPVRQKPALIVLLVVDQFRADYVTQFGSTWTRGLRRLIDNGAYFRQAAYPYAATETCPGHATIATGALPRTHGIIANGWYDRTTKQPVVCTTDTTKPVAIGGSEGRQEATGRGILYVLQAHLEAQGGLSGKTVSVQGFGNVGSVAARLIHEAGARVTHLSDVRTALHNPAGIDVSAAYAYVGRGGTLKQWADESHGATEVAAEDVLTADVDILVPAAVESVLTAENAPRVRARLIIEGANGPTTAEADAIFKARGLTVIPDILANAGGVTVSYFEWVQARQYLQWTEARVNEELQRLITAAYRAVATRAAEMGAGCSQRDAANIIGIERVVEALELRGYYP